MPTATLNLYHLKVEDNSGQPRYSITTKDLRSHPKISTMLSGPSRELPMPTVSRISSLGQAHATLQHCWTKLSNSWQTQMMERPPSPGSPIEPRQRRQFQQWLAQWEQAFTAYLSFAVASMKSEEVTRCRILKANHLACTVLASDPGLDRSSFDVFEAEFQAIVELALAVWQSRGAVHERSASESPVDSHASGDDGALDVHKPLQVVIHHCSRSTIRNQAVELLARIGAR